MTARYVTDLIEAIKRHADRTAFLVDDRMLSSSEALTMTYQVARALTKLGLRAGDGLVCVSGNLPEALLLRLAAHLLGLRWTGVNLGRPRHEVEHILVDAEPSAVVFDPVAPLRATDLLVLSLGPAEGAVDLLAMAALQSPEPLAVAACDEHIAKLRYTSGTTALPKGVATTFAAMADSYESYRDLCETTPNSLRFLIVTTIAHGAGDLALLGLYLGATVELQPGFDPDAMVAAVERSGPVATLLYPSLLYRLLDHPRAAEVLPGRLVSVIYGGAPTSPSRVRQAVELLGPVLRQVYALTEAQAITELDAAGHAAALADRPELLSSVGRPLPGVEVRVLAAPGEVGEICVRASSMMSGYWRRPDLTAEVVRDGWVHTGDLGRMDEDGYLYLAGRLRDMIIVNEDNCYAVPIESVLASHPGVRHAVVVGTPSNVTGEEIHAFVIGDADEAELRTLVRDELGPCHEPAVVHFVDRIPITDIGKPDKKALQTQLMTAAGIS